MEILEKIEELKQTHRNWEQSLDIKAKKYKVAEAMIELKDNLAIKTILLELEKILNAINGKLLSGDKMTEAERDLLLCDRERCEWFLMKFPGAEKVINNIKEFVKKYD